jgi:hypothetical protein
MTDAYLKSAAQLRELAARVTDAEAQQRMIEFAKEYEAISAARSSQMSHGRKRPISMKEPMLSSVERFPWRGNNV